jgi:hypothetical protein
MGEGPITFLLVEIPVEEVHDHRRRGGSGSFVVARSAEVLEVVPRLVRVELVLNAKPR